MVFHQISLIFYKRRITIFILFYPKSFSNNNMAEKQEVHNDRTGKDYCSIDDHISEHDVKRSPEEIAFIKKLNWKVLPLVFLVIFIQVNF
jgi:hypothetical protein